MKKKVDRLSTPVKRPMVEIDTVRPNMKEHHELFAAVLRDKSPITPERARELKSPISGSFNGANLARFLTKNVVKDPKRPYNKIVKSILNERYM